VSYRYPAWSDTDQFIVVRLSDGKPVEGHYSLQRATDAARTLDEHNERNGHAERYLVKPRSTVEGLL
jgi:hypothetical protein